MQIQLAMANSSYSWFCTGKTLMLILAVTVFSLFVISYGQEGVCYQTRATGYTAYRRYSYSYSYSCGWWGWRRCRRTAYSRQAYTAYRIASEFDCCPGYSACASNSDRCCAICDEPCQNEGTCDRPNLCTCVDGWTNNFCDTDVNECANDTVTLNDCDHLCTNTLGSYNCSCYEGYELSTDGYTCLDINECTEGSADCSDLCHNIAGDYYCSCSQSGYRLQSDNITCQNIDECDEDTDGCAQNCTDTDGSYQCSCGSGYTLAIDDHQCDDIDECEQQTDNCDHICENTIGSFDCGCIMGYELTSDLRTCRDTDECSAEELNKCDQFCTNTIGSYNCSCGTGYLLNEDGFQCDDINECLEGTHSCQHICINTNGSYVCDCNEGYALTSDERTCRDVDECIEGGALCTQNCHNSIGSYVCTCLDGYIISTDGIHCIDIDECAKDIDGCSDYCTNTEGSFICSCSPGFDLDVDERTCQEVDECLRGTDLCDQFCANTIGSYSCSCNSGYSLSEDGYSCNEINECEERTDLCQQICINTNGSYVCQCFSGYRMDSDGLSCNEIDECLEGDHQCSQNCNNTPGSYICTCDGGFIIDADGKTCDDINECSDGVHSCQQVCNNTQGSHHCLCFDGYELNSNGHSCDDVNECATGIDECNQNCHNTDGSYSCSCDPGYTLYRDNLFCYDVNECADGGNGSLICPQVCVNDPGTFHCDCYPGYTINSDNVTCSDIDECLERTDMCDQLCANSAGSYICDCDDGYTLNRDGFRCDDINECYLALHNCTDMCENTDGSYLCSCPVGYMLTSDERSCADIDECASGQHECDHNCNNTVGSYTCSCNDGYTLDENGLSCNDVDECVLLLDECEQVCVNLDGSYTCACNEGYEISNSNIYTCQDIDECEPKFETCEHLCTNSNGSFTCACQHGYSITTDRLSCLGPPANIVINITSSRILAFSWNAPVDPKQRHGTVVLTSITCEAEHDHEGASTGHSVSDYSFGDERTNTLDGFLPYNTYNCCVSVRTSLATSPSVCQEARTPEDAPESSPTEITFDNGSPYNISVEWRPPRVPNGVITRYTLYVGFEDGSVDVFYVNGESTSYNITNLQPYQIISVEMSASTSVGEGPHSYTMEVQTAQAAPSEVNNLVVEVLSDSNILVQWDPPTQPNGIITYYNVTVFNEMSGFKFTAEVLAFYEHEAEITELQSFVPYTVQVFASTIAGTSSAVSTMIFTSHGVPVVPALASVERLSALSARVNWIPLTPDEARGVLTLLEIAYEPVRVKGCADFYSMDAELVQMRENLFDQSTTVITGLQPNQEYCVAIKVATSGGESGFSTSLLIPVSKRIPFQLRVILPDGNDCDLFVLSNTTDKIADLRDDISNAIVDMCQCLYSDEFIVDNHLFCSGDKNEIIYQALLLTTDNKTAEEIRNFTQEWVLMKPAINIQDSMYQLDSYCSVVTDELGVITCDAISPTTNPVSSTIAAIADYTGLEVGFIAIMALLALIIVGVAVSVTTYLIMKKRKAHILKQRMRREGPQYLTGLTACNPVLTDSDGAAVENLYEAMGGSADDKIIGQFDTDSLCKEELEVTTEMDDFDDDNMIEFNY